MFVGIRQFLGRNRRKFLIGTGAIGIIYLLLGFVQRKFQEYQLRLTEERFQREQIRRRFEQTQKDALFTIYSLSPLLGESVIKALNVEEITQALQARRLEKRGGLGGGSGLSDVSSAMDESVVLGSNETRKSKNELWSELKVLSLTRLLTLVYSDALLVLFVRLQLNVLARRDFLEDALRLASKKHGFTTKSSETTDADHTEFVTEQAYLSLSWWLLNRGWVQIRQVVQRAVEEVFEEITPRYELDLDELAVLLQKTQMLIEKELSLRELVLPPGNLENFVIQQTVDDDGLRALMNGNAAGNLRVLIDETADYVGSGSSQIVLHSLASAGLALVVGSVGEQMQRAGGPAQARQKLAVVLAATTKLAHGFRQPGAQAVEAMHCVPELDELSASVYSNFG